MAGKSPVDSDKKYVSHTLAEWACSLRYEHLSREAVHKAKLFWFDSMGCALGGSQQEDARILLAHYRDMGGAVRCATFASPMTTTQGAATTSPKSADKAPVTVRREHKAGHMRCRMIGHGGDSWAHLTSGGTVPNLDAVWVARAVRYLPFILRDMQREVGLRPRSRQDEPFPLLGLSPATVLKSLETTFRAAAAASGPGSAS